MTDANNATLTGKVVADRYEIREHLASGGMGAVYRAYDRNLNRDVAIKVLHEGIAIPEFVARFRQEAQLAARLAHPNILAIYDFGGGAGSFAFMAMEWLEGETLARRLQREATLSPDETRRILQGLAAALDYAHANGVNHRDIKPSNIMLTPVGVKLIDFGIAQLRDELNKHTHTGKLIGTATYIPPERWLGERSLTQASDQYSVAVLAYEMLAGYVPFADSQAHLKSRPSYDHIPPALRPVFERALAKEPAARYPSVGAFYEAFAAAAGETKRRTASDTRSETIPLEQVRRWWRSARPTSPAVAVLGVVALVLFALVLLAAARLFVGRDQTDFGAEPTVQSAAAQPTSSSLVLSTMTPTQASVVIVASLTHTAAPTEPPAPAPTEPPAPAPTEMPAVVMVVTNTLTPIAATATPLPSSTPTDMPTPTALPSSTPTIVPTVTALPSSTSTIVPTVTALPSSTPTIVPTVTALPSSTSTIVPTVTALPSSTPTDVPTATATLSPAPTDTVSAALTCDTLYPAVLASAAACTAIRPGEVCLLSAGVTVSDSDGVPVAAFAAPGARLPLSEVEKLASAPLDLDAGSWGVSRLWIDAGTTQAQLTLVGALTLENRANDPRPTLPLTALINANIRRGPDSTYALSGNLLAGDRATAVARDADGSWLRLEGSFGYAGDQPGWVAANETIFGALDRAAILALPTEDAALLAPMQAFTLRLAATETPAPCDGVPPDLLLIQSTGSAAAQLVVNGLTLAVEGTTVVRLVTTDAGEALELTALERGASVNGNRVFANYVGVISLDGSGWTVPTLLTPESLVRLRPLDTLMPLFARAFTLPTAADLVSAAQGCEAITITSPVDGIGASTVVTWIPVAGAASYSVVIQSGETSTVIGGASGVGGDSTVVAANLNTEPENFLVNIYVVAYDAGGRQLCDGVRTVGRPARQFN